MRRCKDGNDAPYLEIARRLSERWQNDGIVPALCRTVMACFLLVRPVAPALETRLNGTARKTV